MVWLPSLLGQCVKALLILMHPEHWSNQHGWIVWKQQRMKTRVEVHNHQHIYPQSHNSPKMVPNTLPQMEHEPQQPLKTSASSLTLQDWGKVHNLETAPSGGIEFIILATQCTALWKKGRWLLVFSMALWDRQMAQNSKTCLSKWRDKLVLSLHALAHQGTP